MKYYVKVGETTYDVVIEGDDVRVNGARRRAHIEAVAPSVYALRLDGRVYQLAAKPGPEPGVYDVALEGRRLTVEALDARARAIRELAGAGTRVAGPAHLVAPMPGLIVRVNVSEGDRVQPGQGLVVMEAMKMENELRAASAGVVKRVAVSQGSAVEKGAILLEMG